MLVSFSVTAERVRFSDYPTEATQRIWILVSIIGFLLVIIVIITILYVKLQRQIKAR